MDFMSYDIVIWLPLFFIFVVVGSYFLILNPIWTIILSLITFIIFFVFKGFYYFVKPAYSYSSVATYPIKADVHSQHVVAHGMYMKIEYLWSYFYWSLPIIILFFIGILVCYTQQKHISKMIKISCVIIVLPFMSILIFDYLRKSYLTVEDPRWTWLYFQEWQASAPHTNRPTTHAHDSYEHRGSTLAHKAVAYHQQAAMPATDAEYPIQKPRLYEVQYPPYVTSPEMTPSKQSPLF